MRPPGPHGRGAARTSRPVQSWLRPALLLLLSCSTAPPPAAGVYRSGPNAVVKGTYTGEVRVWGADGTLTRLASPGPDGTTLLGQAGPLWVLAPKDPALPAPKKGVPVNATLVERAGFRLGEVLGATSTGAADAALAGGVYVRSTVKTRREHAPPVYLVTGTVDPLGAGRLGGPSDVRSGEACRAAVGVLDEKGGKLLASRVLDAARTTCAVPMVMGPVEPEVTEATGTTAGAGGARFLVHGQQGQSGFRQWFSLGNDGSLTEIGAADVWVGIP